MSGSLFMQIDDTYYTPGERVRFAMWVNDIDRQILPVLLRSNVTM